MTRAVFDEARIHPAIRPKLGEQGRAVIAEVERAIAAHAVVVVGMALNPFPRKARKWLTDAGIAFEYLAYGSYFSGWRQRLPLKLWTGWTTFPMIFVAGEFIGGAEDLQRLGVDAIRKAAAPPPRRA
ncbi:MAG: glutaredoxin [Burkholderiaceae bacterium]